MAGPRAAKTTKALPKPVKTVETSTRRISPPSRPAPVRSAAPKATTSSDYEGARRLLSRYCALLDRGQLAEMSQLFHREAVFSVSFDGGKKHQGRDTIHAWYNKFYQGRPGEFRYPRHKLYEPLLTMKGNSATASTYFDSDFVDPDGNVRIIAGRYDDVLAKARGQWFFKERTITVCYHYSPGKGEEGMKQ